MIRAGALASILLLAPAAQEDPIREFLNKPRDADLAASATTAARRALARTAEDKKDDPVWTAVYWIVARAAADPQWLGRDQRRVLQHLDEIGFPDHAGLESKDHLRLAQALGVRSEPLEALAMAHLEAALEGGADVAPVAQALRLERVGDRFAAGETAVLARMHADLAASKPPAVVALDARFDKAKSAEVRYVRAALILRVIEKETHLHKDLQPLLAGLRSDRTAKAHADALIEGLKPYLACSSCAGKRETVCTPCGARGKRTLLCHYCDGKGVFEEMQGTTRVMKGCPACLNKAAEREETCNFCRGKGRVACERCKFMIPKYQALVTESDCGRCAGSGLLLRRGTLACFQCRGLGKILRPALEPSALVSPPE